MTTTRTDPMPPLGELFANVMPHSPGGRLGRAAGLMLTGAACLYAATIVFGVVAMVRPTLKPIVGWPAVIAYLAGSALFLVWAVGLIVRTAADMLRSNSVLADRLARQMAAEEALADLLVSSASVTALGKLDRRITLELKLAERLVIAATSAGALLPAATATASLLPGSASSLGDTLKVGIAALLLGFAIGRLLRADFLERLLKLQFVVGEALRRMTAEAPPTISPEDR